ncbi:GNAT family N-acetyltransferase [Pediococcus acidilactici]|uniref:GNAT family N-acetyltransferase n=1 Tax=Pediococcus acidilactici TaxID=1254 RepID=UPI00132F8340|nr:GNAT family N-acetyltransferase [Pediococcus acidilactici]KAF0500470.1 GNAT family N-acetyltransferase [Pediococcus acidilactici]
MKKFEFYHPILTNQYSLDWLTKTKVKDIFALRSHPQIAQHEHRSADQELTDTVAYVNQVMRQVMNNHALVWGITRRADQQFIGILGLTEFADHPQQATIQFTLPDETLPVAAMTEVLKRLIIFAFQELELSQINGAVDQEDISQIQVLKEAGFSLVKTTGTIQHYQLSSTDKF